MQVCVGICVADVHKPSTQMFIIYFPVTLFHGSESTEVNGGGKALSIFLLLKVLRLRRIYSFPEMSSACNM